MGFHTILTLSYLVPNLYLFIRIWQLFIPKKYRLFYIIIYALLFSVYPLSNLFNDRDAGIAAQALETVANYLLPFFLYLFLFVILADLDLIIIRFTRIIPPELVGKQKFRSRLFLVIICLSVMVVIGGVINFSTIRTSEYQVVIPLKIVQHKPAEDSFCLGFSPERKYSCPVC